MADEIDFYSLSHDLKIMMLEHLVDRGKCTGWSEGMCGEIYIFDQGVHVTPRYVCAKVPKLLANASKQDVAKRFVAEMDRQLSFFHHAFVHWPFDFKSVMQVPVALFRYWGSDLAKLISNGGSSIVEKISIMIYVGEGLKHCASKGLSAHQDLKPQNIFLRDVKTSFPDLPDLDIYRFPLIADFGLSNSFLESGIYEGCRPFMAPEQWQREPLSLATDVFALGVIFYLMLTDGYHPVGIKLEEHWPVPLPDNSKKWTRPSPWKKWCLDGAKVAVTGNQEIQFPGLTRLIKDMLSLEPANRPDVHSIVTRLLDQLVQMDPESQRQVSFLIEHYRSEATADTLEVSWPHLSERWEWFKSEFG